MYTQNLHMDVFSGFIHNRHNLEVTKLYVNRWTDT